jgi:hypothetical protein
MGEGWDASKASLLEGSFDEREQAKGFKVPVL